MSDDPTTTDASDLILELEAQEIRLQFDGFTHADAWELGSLLVAMGSERGLGITIDITRGDQQLFHAALAGTSPDNDEWIARKTRVVRRFGHSSYLVGLSNAARGTDLVADFGLPLNQFAPHGGSFPITVRGTGPVGTVTVSGLPQADDHALVVEALESFLAR
jgi:uncharacterized protein (UPF0303 family)